MNLDHFATLPKEELHKTSTIAIVGNPKAGKTTLALAIAQATGHTVIHADDYLNSYTFKEVAKAMCEDLKKREGRYIIEGVQTARALKYGLELGWQPDLVILVKSSKPCEPRHRGIVAVVNKSLEAWKKQSNVPLVQAKRKKYTELEGSNT